MSRYPSLIALSAALLGAAPVMAQQTYASADRAPAAASDSAKNDTTPAKKTINTQPEITLQYFKPVDARALNQFETPKDAGVAFTGFKLSWGAAFTQQFQDLSHSNSATPNVVNNVDANQLMNIGSGFNNAVANLYLNAQLAPGIRVAMTSYLSSRHHNETWVKDGYLLVDESPIHAAALDNLMKYVTLRVGHFEVNYGDAHFRRTDNGNALQNPFVGNLIMDAFTTEIGGEVYVRANGFMAMGGITGGEIRGNVQKPDSRAPSYLAKLGFDRKMSEDLRVRLTGSLYTTSKSISNTLYGGDRAGSRYYLVLENTAATEAANKSSGMIDPGFKSKVTAMQINPFVKVGNLELFGVIEQAKGRAATETVNRDIKQYAGDVVYRLLNDKLYVGGRYDRVKGQLAGMTDDITINRVQMSGGWFLTPSIMLKGEYVKQKYLDFPTTDIRNGGKFDGFVMEGVVAF